MGLIPIIKAATGFASLFGARSAGRGQAKAARQAARMQIEAAERATVEQRAAADRAFGIQSDLTREGIAAQDLGMNEANRFVQDGVTGANRLVQDGVTGANNQLTGFRNEDVARFDPFVSSGVGAQNALAFNLGVGGRPEGYQGFTGSPGYDFRFGQGMDAVQGSVAARQGLNSGAAMKELNRFGQGIASNEWNNYIAQLSGLAGSGQNAANSQANVSMGYGGQIAGNTMAGGMQTAGNTMAGGMQQGSNRMQGGANTGNALMGLGSNLGNLTVGTSNNIANNMMAAGNAGATGVASAGNARAAGTVGMANAFNNFGEQMAGNWQFNQMNNAFSRDRNPGFTPPQRPAWNTSQFWTGNY